MKQFFALAIFGILLVFLTACETTGNRADDTGGEAKVIAETGYNALLSAYLVLKDALVEGDKKRISEKAGFLKKTLQQLETTQAGAVAQAWKEKLGKINTCTEKVAAASDVKAQREAFSPLSEEVIAFAKETPSDKKVYVQHCPMALNNTGAKWISDSEEILNPYFGDAMLHCGGVTETIEKN